MIGDDLLDLGGQVALVTGAGQSVGREIALTLAKHNAGGIAVNDFVLERAAAVAAEIEALGVRAVPVSFDVGDLEAVRGGVKAAAESLGPVTLLVNNAGNAGPNAQIGLGPEFWESDPGDWDRFFRTNTFGVMNCCHAAIPGMIQAGRGRIVAIVSDAGRVGEARLAPYAAAKAAAAGFVRALAKETGRYGVTCNAISLSAVAPPMEAEKARAFEESDQARRQVSRYVIRRFGRPSDVAGMAAFLCSDAAAFITGQTYPVNGGYSFAV
ncbi:MAG TPA: SDR family oxidoreductase [Phenylobacterium sp.]|uniref:SDR family NAD(P)-dependent oxidoreductase n=1 Tax=Phenylobacterium sp. TaxID=1871053 RepID=UPI002B463924|nr:SDR family oxidoreductase [Phenylobacterium sp.]HKR88677.1 SDR family oxidoreductase [Phenylobacterium sp.]